MRRLTLAIMILFATVGITFAQSDAHFSLFEFNTLNYNPGYAGSNDAICVTSVHRQQWLGFEEGRPQSTVFSVDMPINAINSGVGLTIFQESIGFQKDLSITATYAYRLDLDYGTLGIGVNLGLISRAINGDWVSPESLNGGQVFTDPVIPHMDSKMVFDVGLGAYYRYDNFYAGLSSLHITEPVFKFNGSDGGDDSKNPFVKRHYYIVGGYIYQLPNPMFELKPSVLVQTDFATAEFSVNGQFIFNKKFWGGVTYRYDDAIVPMLGIHLLNGISVGYSYDIVLSDIAGYTSGSHEIVVRYCFNMDMGGGVGRYRSVRRL
ncbi:MAG: type IX secretion system membrane protein PorP/SprF [Bacteroidota bacterium]|nr:type IX secretion system membrane protein PorP/SprF [Bacteroidota bacterium]